MRDFDAVLKKSVLLGHFIGTADVISAAAQIMDLIPDASCSINDGGGKMWAECYDNSGRLIVLLHTYYKTAFVLSEYAFKIDDVHCEKVSDFLTAEWFIDDVNGHNRQFPLMKWDEPAEVCNHRKFCLLDMRFVTE